MYTNGAWGLNRNRENVHSKKAKISLKKGIYIRQSKKRSNKYSNSKLLIKS